MKRHDPRTSEDKRALMRRVIDTQSAKSVLDLERYLQVPAGMGGDATQVREGHLQTARRRQLDDDIKVDCIIALWPARLQEHVNMAI